MLETNSSLLDLLMRLETELHTANVRRDASRLDQLLHEEFEEFGRSGRAYRKADIIRVLVADTQPPVVVSEDFRLKVLGDSAALLTYRSAHRLADGTLAMRTLRASIWTLSPKGWQMLFHQGTPVTA